MEIVKYTFNDVENINWGHEDFENLGDKYGNYLGMAEAIFRTFMIHDGDDEETREEKERGVKSLGGWKIVADMYNKQKTEAEEVAKRVAKKHNYNYDEFVAAFKKWRDWDEERENNMREVERFLESVVEENN